MNDETKTFLDSLKEIESDKVKVFIKSQNKEVDAIPLTFKQQKDIISTVADGGVGALKLQKFLNDVIIDNTGENVLVSDKVGIILQLRSNSIGSSITLDDREYTLDYLIDKFKKHRKPKEKKVIKDKVTVHVKIPTLKDENKIITSTIDSFKRNGDEVAKSLGQIYTYEIAKFIDKVEFEGKGVEFSDTAISDRIKIVEALPLSTNKKIVEYIQEVKKIENECLKFEDGPSVEIDVAFFDG